MVIKFNELTVSEVDSVLRLLEYSHQGTCASGCTEHVPAREHVRLFMYIGAIFSAF